MSDPGPTTRPLPETGAPPFEVRCHPLVSDDLARERLTERLHELYWFIAEYRQLEHWPLTEREELRLAESLGIKRVECRVDAMFAAKFKPTSSAKRMLIVYFWVDPHSRCVWILHVSDGDYAYIRHTKERRACRRLTDIKGYDHDRRNTP